MRHTFSDREGLRIAIEMEKRGEAFYRRASHMSTDSATIALLLSLAEDEVRHCGDFTRLYEQAGVRADDAPYPEETNAYLSAVAADIIFPGGLMSMHRIGFNDPVAVLEAAIASEKDSVLFYTELAGLARSSTACDTFREIARQERRHLAALLGRMNDLKGGA